MGHTTTEYRFTRFTCCGLATCRMMECTSFDLLYLYVLLYPLSYPEPLVILLLTLDYVLWVQSPANARLALMYYFHTWLCPLGTARTCGVHADSNSDCWSAGGSVFRSWRNRPKVATAAAHKPTHHQPCRRHSRLRRVLLGGREPHCALCSENATGLKLCGVLADSHDDCRLAGSSVFRSRRNRPKGVATTAHQSTHHQPGRRNARPR